jgi:hypothetical protein
MDKPVIAAWRSCGAPLGNPILAREKAMAHDHRNEYQVEIVCENGTEELSAWMNSEEQVAQEMAAVHT